MIKVIKLSASIGYAGTTVSDEYEVPEYWEELTEEEQQKELEGALQDFLDNKVSASVWVEERD